MIRARLARVVSDAPVVALVAGGVVALTIVWSITGRPLDAVRAQRTATEVLVEAAEGLRQQIALVVEPATRRSRLIARDPVVIEAVRGRDPLAAAEACDRAIRSATEIDAVLLFDADGRLLAMNRVHPDGTPIEPERLARILAASFEGRTIVEGCLGPQGLDEVLEFQDDCDVTPALFDSSGLSVAHSLPITAPSTGEVLGLASVRLRFDRLTDLLRAHDLIGGHVAAHFVADDGAVLDQRVQFGLDDPPIARDALAAMLEPVLEGGTDQTLTRRNDGYVGLFPVNHLETIDGGGMHVMVSAPAAWVDDEVVALNRRETAIVGLVGLLLLAFAALVLAGIRAASQSRSIAEARARLATEQALHSEILSVLPCQVWWKDRDGRYLGCNDAFARAVGLDAPEAVVGRSDEELPTRLLVEDPDRLDDQAVMASGRPSLHVEHTVRHPDGRALTLHSSRLPLNAPDGSDGSDGAIMGVIGMALDVTERTQLETRLAQARKLESIGQLAAGVAHEINTPTQYIGDNVRFLREHFGDILRVLDRYAELLDPASPARSWSERQADVQAIHDELDLEFLRAEIPLAIDESLQGVEQVASIVTAMKDFSHPGSESMEAVDLNRAITSTVAVCRNRWKYVADLELDLEPALPEVNCHGAAINQVILNLVVNASDAIAERTRADGSARGTIRVSSRRRGEAIEVRVGDDGAGMPAHVQARLFEPFFTTKDVGQGTGQGLAICRDVVVEKHGGQLEFESTPGVGTCFTMTLPLDQPAEHRSAA